MCDERHYTLTYKYVRGQLFKSERKESEVTRLCPTLCDPPWTVAYQAPPSMDSPGKSTGVGCHFLFQGTFPTQGSNPGLLHCRQMLFTI